MVETGSATQAASPIRITDGFVLAPINDDAGRNQGIDPQPIQLTDGNPSTPTNGMVETGSATQAANPIRITDGFVLADADPQPRPIELTNGTSTPTNGMVETGSATQAANPIRITDGFVLADADPQPRPIELTNGTSTPTNGMVETGSATQAANPIRITDGFVLADADPQPRPIELTNGTSTPTNGMVETGSAVQAANPIRIMDGFVLAPTDGDARNAIAHEVKELVTHLTELADGHILPANILSTVGELLAGVSNGTIETASHPAWITTAASEVHDHLELQNVFAAEHQYWATLLEDAWHQAPSTPLGNTEAPTSAVVPHYYYPQHDSLFHV